MTTKRSWILVGLMCLLPLALGGCLTAVELSPEDAVDASDHYGNIHIEDVDGVKYIAQSLEYDGESDAYLLRMVEIFDDGVESNAVELQMAKDRIVSVKYYKNNKWMVWSLMGGATLFIVWLYYSINTTVFD